MTMESKGTVATDQAGAGEFGQSDVRELRPTDPLASATDALEAPSVRRVALVDDDRPPESLEGDLLEPEEDEATPSLGSPKGAASTSSHKPPPRPSHNPPHPPEKGASLSPPRPSHAPGSDSEIRLSPPLINMGFDGLQMLLETRLRELNTELSKVAQASGRGQLLRGTLLLLAFAAAGGAIGYFSGASAEARTRANIREEVMKTYYGSEIVPAKRKEILGFVEGQLAKSDLGLRLWVDGEQRRVDQELKEAESEVTEVASLRSELEKKDAELAQLKEDLEKALAAKPKASRVAARSAAALAPAAPRSEEQEASPAPASAAEPSPEE